MKSLADRIKEDPGSRSASCDTQGRFLQSNPVSLQQRERGFICWGERLYKNVQVLRRLWDVLVDETLKSTIMIKNLIGWCVVFIVFVFPSSPDNVLRAHIWLSACWRCTITSAKWWTSSNCQTPQTSGSLGRSSARAPMGRFLKDSTRKRVMNRERWGNFGQTAIMQDCKHVSIDSAPSVFLGFVLVVVIIITSVCVCGGGGGGCKSGVPVLNFFISPFYFSKHIFVGHLFRSDSNMHPSTTVYICSCFLAYFSSSSHLILIFNQYVLVYLLLM